MLKTIIFHILRFCGASLVWWQLQQNGKVTILCFHDPSCDDFRRYVRHLKKWYNIISLEAYLTARVKGSMVDIPDHALVLTIDDGHRRNVELGVVLAEENICVTIFLVTGNINTTQPFWWTLPSAPSEVEALKRVPNHTRLNLLKKTPTSDTVDRQALTSAEIKYLARYASFQSHTRSHPILPRCTTAEAKEEIVESKADIEQLFGWTVTSLAYPNGDYSERDIQLTRDAGYLCALTVDEGHNDARTDLFRLKRVPIDDDAGVSELLVKASGLMPVIKAWVSRFLGRQTEQLHATSC